MQILRYLNETLANPRLLVEKVSDGLWPSESGLFFETPEGFRYREGGCSRRTWYRLHNYPKVASEDLGGRIVTQLGRDIQNILTAVSKVGRVYLGDEVPIMIRRVSPKGRKYFLSGSIDMIVQDPDTGRPILVEVKTIGLWKAQDGLCQPSTSGRFEPEVEHVLQVLPYLEAAREMGVSNPECHIIYICRDKPRLQAEHVVSLDADGTAVISNDLHTVRAEGVSLARLYEDMDNIVDADEPPPRNYQIVYDNRLLIEYMKLGKLTKTQAKVIEKAIKDGTINGDNPVLTLGSFECSVCPYKNACYGLAETGTSGNFLPSGNIQKTDTNAWSAFME